MWRHIGRGPRRCKPHREEESASFSRFAFNSNPSTHEFHQAGRNRQSQASAAVASRGRSIGLPEGIKNQLLHLGRNADTCINYLSAKKQLSPPGGFLVGGWC